MRKLSFLSGLAGALFIFFGCSTNNSTGPGDSKTNDSEWLIPVSQIYDGGPGKDGIPALTNPSMITPSQASYLQNDDLVIAIKLSDEIRIYPHSILDWHEIINDGIGQQKYSVTYCPLTGSGIAWNRVLDGKETTFGVSGLLYNTNLIPYDRATDSNWSQMKLKAVNGPNIGRNAEIYPVVETTWAFIKQFYPNSLVVSSVTGIYSSSQYGAYPYGDYKTNNQELLFPVTFDDRRLPRKERVHGVIIDDATQVFRFSSFAGEINVVNTHFNGTDLIVAGSQKNNFIVSFGAKQKDGTVLVFSEKTGDFPNILTDQEGNVWDLFGEAVDGPRKGQKLTPTRSYNAYWFAWGAFWPDAKIYGQ